MTIVSIISHCLFAIVWDMRAHDSDPCAAEDFPFPDAYEAARELLKKDNPSVFICYAEMGGDTVKVIADAISQAEKC